MQKSNRNGKIDKILGVLVTMLIIGLLVFVGPVDAYQLQLSGLKSSYNFGDTINFLSKVNINSDERVPIKNVSLEVNNQVVCTFDVLGNKLTACNGVNISLVSNTVNYGYGYGYNSFINSSGGNYTGQSYGYGYGYGGSGEIVYNVSIQTPQSYMRFGMGNRIRLITTTQTQVLNSRVYDVVINPLISGNGVFLFGYDSANVLFWGKYNSTDYTLVGEVRVLDNPSIRLIGMGTYSPSGIDSGNWTVGFYNADSPNVGFVAQGEYNRDNWYLYDIGNRLISVNGTTFVAPR
jgi:hypothetical protein